ncbi:MAG: GH3 auxin-responsive promoter family protein [Flavobacteriia bacterium]|nr:GH3 auxin-responsive promoter family protein [Flavobacteriia bacterium]
MPFNSIFAWIIKKRIHQIDLFRKYPIDVQNELLFSLLNVSKDTEFGAKHHFSEIKSYSKYKESVELSNYETLKSSIERIINGEQNILWPTETKWFAKSSGTTSDKSKYIPVTKESLFECHYKGGKDLLALYYENNPNSKLFNGKHLIVGGSAQINPVGLDSYLGDLSAIIVKNLPWWAELKRTPSKEIALMSDWEEKILKMAQETIHEDVYTIAGVPSWTYVLLQKILEISGKKTIKEVWPNLEVFLHGGVSFEPYKKLFDDLMVENNINYIETYNASEGFFGIQDQLNSNELLLMLDYGIFYEFIPMSDFHGIESNNVINLSEVEENKNYALVISTNGGLWRYIIGDTIRFTSLKPFRFVITGRTKSFINVFGEEIIVENAEKAITSACLKHHCSIKDFTVAPVFLEKDKQGYHQWLIEFIIEPENLEDFRNTLDVELRNINSDYDAKRSKDILLKKLTINSLKPGVFNQWLKINDKLGGQNKIPRLCNDRKLLDEILKLNVNENH